MEKCEGIKLKCNMNHIHKHMTRYAKMCDHCQHAKMRIRRHLDAHTQVFLDALHVSIPISIIPTSGLCVKSAEIPTQQTSSLLKVM